MSDSNEPGNKIQVVEREVFEEEGFLDNSLVRVLRWRSRCPLRLVS